MEGSAGEHAARADHAAQRPDATNVAGYRAWQGLSRQVRRGERAIRILAPIVVKRTDANGDPQRAVVGFRSVNVFDVAQTDGEPLPEPPSCVPHDGDELAHCLPALEGHARELGYVEGKNIIVEPRFADGDYKRLPGLVQELLALKVDVLVTAATPPSR